MPETHLRLVTPPHGSERPADALERHRTPSLPELAVRLVQTQQGVRYARREMLLKAWAAGHEGRALLSSDSEAAYALFGMRLAYRTSARMLRPFDRSPAPTR